MDISFLKNKKIAILGYGREGQALARFFTSHGLQPDVLDKDEALAFPLDAPVRPILGAGYMDKLKEYDLIFRSPGIPFLTPAIQEALKSGAEVTSLTKLFFRLAPCPIIGITGTKGKGTTATLVYEILKSAGKDVYLGGNIGNTPLDFLNKLDADSFAVLELSSFQLQDLDISPHYAVVLNITSDHLNYHHDVSEYRKAKENLILRQKSGDFAILNADYETTRKLAFKTPAAKYWFSTTAVTEPGTYLLDGSLYLNLAGEEGAICGQNEILLRGLHNVENVLAAVLVSALAGADMESIRSTVLEYKGMAHHRLEYVGKINDVEYYNDSASTLPDATIAALRSFSGPKVVILGGADKGADYLPLAVETAAQDVPVVILIGKTAPKIETSLKESGYRGKLVAGLKNMQDVVRTAVDCAPAGGTVLLSPACFSFDMFANYEDRGEQFTEAVKKNQPNQEP